MPQSETDDKLFQYIFLTASFEQGPKSYYVVVVVVLGVQTIYFFDHETMYLNIKTVTR